VEKQLNSDRFQAVKERSRKYKDGRGERERAGDREGLYGWQMGQSQLRVVIYMWV
jgi:hypothetical protein